MTSQAQAKILFNVDPFYADDTTFAGTNEAGKKTTG